MPDVDPEKARLAYGGTVAWKLVKSYDVRTCLTVAPAVCVVGEVPACPRTIVIVSLVWLVIKTISSLIVSTSIATVKTSTLPAASDTPPIRALPVPVATVIVVAPDVAIAF